MPGTTTTQRASRGRPDSTSSRDVEALILRVAEARFATTGYAATSVREIADEAGVNPAMIHYYFGSKESLLKSVLEKALLPLATSIEAMQNAKSVAPGDILRMLMRTIASHPHLPYLVMREVMLPGGVMQEHFARNLAPRLGGALPGLLNREADQGSLRQDITPQVAALGIMSLAIFPFVVRPVAEKVLDVHLSGEALKQFEDQVAEFVDRGLAP